MQFFYDAAGGQRWVQVAQMWRASGCGYTAPERVFRESEVPGEGGWSRSHLTGVRTCVTGKTTF